MKNRSETDWDRIDKMRDEDIDTSDIPELDESFFANAVIRLPKPKASVTLRIDRELLDRSERVYGNKCRVGTAHHNFMVLGVPWFMNDWFKSQGKGYQTRINAVLKAYKEAHS